MIFIDDAGRLWHRLWSVRLNLLGAGASAIDAGWQAHITGQPRVVSVITMLISLVAAVARLVAQPKAHRG